MRPRKTPSSNRVYQLEGGNEDNDLWVAVGLSEGGNVVVSSVWELTLEERVRIAAGANVELIVWGEQHPPVAMTVTDEQPIRPLWPVT